MLEIIHLIDNGFLYFVSQYSHNFFLSVVFYFFSGVGSWGVVWLGIGLVLLLREKRDYHYFFGLCLAISLSLIVVEGVFKNVIGRSRPDLLAYPLFVGVPHLSSYSFPSTHATIAFAAAFILSQKHKKYTAFYYSLAALIAFSRIYLGQHFPSDVVGGVVIGTGIGMVSLKMARLRNAGKIKKR